MKNGFIILCSVVALSISAVFAAVTRTDLPAELQTAQIADHSGQAVSINNLTFNDEAGQSVKLADYFGQGRPVVLLLAYYNCPSLCGLLLQGATNSLRSLDWSPGKEFDVVVVSINPKENSDLARMKKENMLKYYGRLEAATGVHFLTGAQDQIEQLAKEVGFGYYFDPSINEYAHSAGIFVLTADGVISRVLYGVDFPSRDLKLSLLEASKGLVGTAFEKFMMFCYRYDPTRRGYALQAMRLVQFGGALTLVVLLGYMFIFWRRERRRDHERSLAA